MHQLISATYMPGNQQKDDNSTQKQTQLSPNIQRMRFDSQNARPIPKSSVTIKKSVPQSLGQTIAGGRSNGGSACDITEEEQISRSYIIPNVST
jgi:hypothetical protein